MYVVYVYGQIQRWNRTEQNKMHPPACAPRTCSHPELGAPHASISQWECLSVFRDLASRPSPLAHIRVSVRDVSR